MNLGSQLRKGRRTLRSKWVEDEQCWSQLKCVGTAESHPGEPPEPCGAWAKAERGFVEGLDDSILRSNMDKTSLSQWLEPMLFLHFHPIRASKHFHTNWLLLARLLENTETWQRKIEVVIKYNRCVWDKRRFTRGRLFTSFFSLLDLLESLAPSLSLFLLLVGGTCSCTLWCGPQPYRLRMALWSVSNPDFAWMFLKVAFNLLGNVSLSCPVSIRSKISSIQVSIVLKTKKTCRKLCRIYFWGFLKYQAADLSF